MDFRCSFCGRLRTEAAKLVSGPRVFICDACVAECVRAFPDGPPAAGPAAFRLEPHGPVAPEGFLETLRASAGFGDSGSDGACSFCGRAASQTRIIARGYVRCICDGCLGVCVGVLADALAGPWTELRPLWPAPRA